MAGNIRLKPVGKWKNEELWTAFLLLDTIHDFGDAGRIGKDAVAAIFPWYMSQPIPFVLYGTIGAPVGLAGITIKMYAKTLLDMSKDVTPSTDTEDLFRTKLIGAIPERLGCVPTKHLIDDAKSLNFVYSSTGTHYTIAMQTIQDIMKLPDGDVKNKFIRLCVSLRGIRFDESGYNRKGELFDNETATKCNDVLQKPASIPNLRAFDSFFRSILAGSTQAPLAGGDFYANYDAAPNISKYIMAFTQIYTPLNRMDSATSSTQLHYYEEDRSFNCNPTPATARNIEGPWTYARQLLTLGQQAGEQPLYIPGLTPNGVSGFKVNGDGTSINFITGTPSAQSGPTLPYLAAWMFNILKLANATLTFDDVERVRPKDFAGYNLVTLLQSFIGRGRRRDEILRFLCDWKGYGDAEQVRYAALKIAEVPDAEFDKGGTVGTPVGRPTKKLIMATVDRNSWLAMRLSGLTCCYSNHVGGYHDFLLNPATPPTPGQKAYSTFTTLSSQMSAVLTLAGKFGDGSTLDELTSDIDGILGYLENPDQYDALLRSFNINKQKRTEYLGNDKPAWNQNVVRFLVDMLKKKFENAQAFVSRLESRRNEFDEFKDIQIPTIDNPEQLIRRTTEADVAAFTIGNNNPPMPITDYISIFSNAIEKATFRIEQAKTLLSKFPLTTINNVPERIVPATIFQTETLIGDTLKNNPILAFETSPYKTLFSMLDVMPLSFTCTDVNTMTKPLEAFSDAYRSIVNGLFLEDGISNEEYKDETSKRASAFVAFVKDELNKARAIYTGKVGAAEKASTRGDLRTTMENTIQGTLDDLLIPITLFRKDIAVPIGVQAQPTSATMGGGQAQTGGGKDCFDGTITAFIEIARIFKQAYTGLQGGGPNMFYIPVNPLPPAAARRQENILKKAREAKNIWGEPQPRPAAAEAPAAQPPIYGFRQLQAMAKPPQPRPPLTVQPEQPGQVVAGVSPAGTSSVSRSTTVASLPPPPQPAMFATPMKSTQPSAGPSGTTRTHLSVATASSESAGSGDISRQEVLSTSDGSRRSSEGYSTPAQLQRVDTARTTSGFGGRRRTYRRRKFVG